MTRTYRKYDQFGNFLECIQTWCWVEDKKDPKIVKCPNDIYLGCNPDLSEGLPLPSKQDFKDLKVVDDCDVNIEYEDAFSIIVLGCEYSRVRKWIVTDQCGNAAECYQVYSWIMDNDPPTLLHCPEDLFLGCVTEVPDIDDSDLIEATDDCGEVTIERLPVHININPVTCRHEMLIPYSITDECGNVSYCSQEVVYKLLNNLPPEPAIPFPADVTICGPIPAVPNYEEVYDACGVGYPVMISSSIQNGPCDDGDGCIITRTFIRRSCGSLAEIQDQVITIDCNITIGESLFESVDNSKNPNLISATPNPSQHFTEIFWENFISSEGHLVIYDQSGKEVYQTVLNNLETRNSHRLDLNAFHSGVYIVQIITSEENRTLRLVKQ